MIKEISMGETVAFAPIDNQKAKAKAYKAPCLPKSTIITPSLRLSELLPMMINLHHGAFRSGTYGARTRHEEPTDQFIVLKLEVSEFQRLVESGACMSRRDGRRDTNDIMK
jgi:hypothetical protein